MHKLDYNKILKNIYIGTNTCCMMHFKKELLKKGINADISLEAERVDNPKGVKFFIWLPTKDHTAPTQEQLFIGVKIIEYLLNLKKKIYIHCKNGHGRAPTMLAAYLIWKKKITVEEAIKIIKNKRGKIHLNTKQINALKKFRKLIK